MEPELVYEDFIVRLDGPVIEMMATIIQHPLRVHVNFACASLTPTRRGDKVELCVDDGGSPDAPLVADRCSGSWRVWRFEVPITDEPELRALLAEAESRRTPPRPS